MSDNVMSCLEERSRFSPDRECIHELDNDLRVQQSLTYRELHQAARRMAKRLAACAAPGSRCVIAVDSRCGFAVCLYACFYAGLVAVPVGAGFNSEKKRDRLEKICLASAAALIVIEAGRESALEGAGRDNGFAVAPLPPRGMFTVCRVEWEQWMEKADPVRQRLCAVNAAVVQYSSGSSGSPKGVIISHGNIAHNSGRIIRAFQLTQKDRGLLWLPHDHDMGLVGGYFVPVMADFPIYFMQTMHFVREPLAWLRALSIHRISCSGGPDSAFRTCLKLYDEEMLLDVNLAAWAVAFNGSDIINADTLQDFTATYGKHGFRYDAFLPCYGLAESTLMVLAGDRHSAPVIDFFPRALVSGETRSSPDQDPLNRAEIPVVASGKHGGRSGGIVTLDLDSHGQCKPLEVGQLAISGDSVCQGYLNLERETRVIRPWHVTVGETEYLLTGDIGFHNGKGLYYILGRTLDRINHNGMNYFAFDLENTITASITKLYPGFTAAAVAANENGVNLYLEVDRATHKLLRQAGSSHAGPEIIFKLISYDGLALTMRHIEQELSFAIEDIFVVACRGLPRTATGKLKRYALSQLRREKEILLHFNWPDLVRHAAVFVAPRCEEEKRLCRLIARVLKLERVGVFDNFFVLGCDSMQLLHIVTVINTAFGVAVSMEEVAAHASVAELAAKIAWRQAGDRELYRPAG